MAENAEWLMILSGIANIVRQYPQWFNDVDKEWLADRTCAVARRVLKDSTDLSVDELEEERQGLHSSAAAFNFDDTYLDSEFESAISDVAPEQSDEDDIDERVNPTHTEESIDIDGLFAELVNRD